MLLVTFNGGGIMKNKYFVSNEDIAKNLMKLFSESNMTYEEIASEIDVSTRVLYYWANGTRLPNINNFYALSKLFNISIENILK